MPGEHAFHALCHAHEFAHAFAAEHFHHFLRLLELLEHFVHFLHGGARVCGNMVFAAGFEVD